MYKINNVLTLLMLFSLSILCTAQNSTSSLYSRYGYGYLKNDGFGRNKGLGGTGFALRSNANINPLNPASYSAIDTMSQIFEFGLMGKVTKMSTANASQYNYDVNLTDLGFAIPISRNIGFAMGLQPVSLVGYSFNSTLEDFSENVSFFYSGSGGMTQVFAGLSVSPIKNLSIGVNAAYYFGSNLYFRELSFPDQVSFSNLSTVEDIHISAIHPTFGIQYTKALTKDYSLTLGGIFEPQTDLNATQTLETSRSAGSQSAKILLEQVTDKPIGMGMPQSYGLGFAFEKNNQLTLTGDYYFQNWEDAEFYDQTDTLVNRIKLSGGIEYIPNYLSQYYFQKVQYRLGSSYSNNYFKVDGEKLYEFGINFGVGLPLRYSKTRFNIAFEYGWMGTENKNLITENYGKISINFSLNSFWFVKRKFE